MTKNGRNTIIVGVILFAVAIVTIVYNFQGNAQNGAENYFKMSSAVNLDVYQTPDLSAPIIGAVSPNADIIEITAEENGFYRVNHSEKAGWIRGEGLSLASIETYPDTDLPLALKCYGEEPFWDASITNGEIEFSFLDLPAEHFSSQSIDREGSRYVFQFEDQTTLSVTKESCASTMFEAYFNWRLDYQGVSEPVWGCCSLQN